MTSCPYYLLSSESIDFPCIVFSGCWCRSTSFCQPPGIRPPARPSEKAAPAQKAVRLISLCFANRELPACTMVRDALAAPQRSATVPACAAQGPSTVLRRFLIACRAPRTAYPSPQEHAQEARPCVDGQWPYRCVTWRSPSVPCGTSLHAHRMRTLRCPLAWMPHVPRLRAPLQPGADESAQHLPPVGCARRPCLTCLRPTDRQAPEAPGRSR